MALLVNSKDTDLIVVVRDSGISPRLSTFGESNALHRSIKSTPQLPFLYTAFFYTIVKIS